MGDVLPPKRQTVVNRLKKRFDLYRNHHNACLPRYEQTSNGLYEAQRQETLLLKQRFLESKTKKSKNHKSEHHRSSCKDTSSDGPKVQPHPKPVKRHHEEPPPSSATDHPKDTEKPAKAARTEKPPPEKPLHQQQPSQQQPSQQQPSIPNFGAQQFGRCSPAQLPAQGAINAVQANSSELCPTANGPTTSNKEPRSSLSESQSDSQPFPGTIPINGGTDVECKKENEGAPDIHPCVSQSSNTGGGGDRLSDTFPSLGFAEDSGDDVIHPDLLKDLIEDVFTNSADIMKDFNFEDSVGSIKDSEDPAKDIIELVKGSSASPGDELRSSFQTDGLNFANSQVSQQNGLFDNAPQNSVSSVPAVATTSTPTTSVTSFYSQTQRLPSYGSGGLGLDFKLTEPSPAALTLKQMAEQHQNMQQKQQQQQQQIVSSPLSNRPPFTQDVFANHINTLRPHFHSGGNMANNANLTQSAGDQTPMMPNNPANQYNAYNPMDSYPGVRPISPNLNSNSNVRLFKQEESGTPTELTIISEDNLSSKHQKLTKPPAYGATRPLTHYSDAAMHHHHHLHLQQQQRHHLHHHQQQHHPMSQLGPSNQFLSPAEQQPSFQISQSQQMHAAQQIHPSPANPDLKQQSSMIQPSHHLYGSYAQQNNDPGLLQHVSMSQPIHYTPQHFQTNAAISNNRPPPEYRAHHPSTVSNDNLQMQAYKTTSAKYMRNQLRPTSVSMSSDGLTRTVAGGDWRQGVVNNQQTLNRIQAYPPQENFVGGLPRNIQHQQFFPHQYQMNIMSGGPPNVATDLGMMQQRQLRLPIQLRPRSEVGSPDVMGQMYSNHQTDISRHQDGSQISLDFLDNIESSASDLLNFDQVMQGNATHFPLLDDIEILGK